MWIFRKFSDLELDIVGIVAILGEGSTLRNAQASALSWHHILPRLYPAPQALLKHNQEKGLPVRPGIVVGALSGRIRNELNFFTQLLHDVELGDYAVELVRVERKPDKGAPDVEVKKWGYLAALSVLGCCMSITLFALSIWQDDGPALLATVFLSATSTFVGLASWCQLDETKEIPNPERQAKTPLGDVVIFYPQTGAFRIIRCSDEISRLYFKVESCGHYFDDNMYRAIAFFSTVLLMGGLIMLGNSQPIMQMAFAASYILLNSLYWLSSALNPVTRVWKHNFDVKELGIVKKTSRTDNVSAMPQNDESASGAGAMVNSSQNVTRAGVSHQYYVNGLWQPRSKEQYSRRVPTDCFTLRADDAQESPENIGAQLCRHISRFVSFAFGIKTNNISPTMTHDQGLALVASAQQFQPADSTTLRPNQSLQESASRKNEKPNLTSALWTVIALTGSARWARSTNIAPNNTAWDQWLNEAERQASARWSKRRDAYVPPCTQREDKSGRIWIQLPEWDYQTRLSDFFKKQSETTRTRYDMQAALDDIDERLAKLRSSLGAVIGLRILCSRYKRRKARVGS